MAYALVKAIEKSNLASAIIMSDRSKERLDFIKKNSVAEITESNKEVLENSDVVFLAVKPQHIAGLLDEIKDFVNEQIIISIAAGIKLDFLENVLIDKKIIRVMPNTPCLVGEMAAGYTPNSLIDEQDLNIVDALLNSAGLAFKVSEDKLDSVTALSGSGPGFYAKIVKHMIKAAVEEGLSEKLARKLAYQTMKGTGKLMLDKNLSPDELITMVASPNGTTVAGLKVLEGASNILEKTIKAASDRSKELGKNE